MPTIHQSTESVRGCGRRKPGGLYIIVGMDAMHFEYVVTGEETDEELERMEKRGIRLVEVIPDKPENVQLTIDEEE